MKKPSAGSDTPNPQQDTVPVLEESVLSERRPVSEEVIPLAEEIARVEKREKVSGKVRVRTLVDTVEEFARAALKTDVVEVSRVPKDQVVDAPPSIRTEDDVVIVPVFEEVLVFEKRLVLKEELHIRRSVTTENVEVPVSLRKQRAVVERVDPDEESDK
ncbi:YsnF/AvaK domain-containing protein [Microvirga lenta]|uniref:YsnF/AvaK domain-containing protein n=1 Tax=Microvirga lenta TaxID=2881337 RepID=UPI001CFFA8D7|nr:YsnF/AvaK domain-containing protein [Microvirga lenta]MCB5175848.1 YsnF/AvaK domain-containing protein [Microvirga lenta]